MKKHVFLTSLIAISLSCGAHAATDVTTDVTFAGTYNNGSADLKNGATAATYDYTKSDGTTATGVDSETAPNKEDFTYIMPDGSDSSLATEETPEYTADSTADGTSIKSTQEIAANATADRTNYTYINGAGTEVKLGETAQDMTETYKLANGDVITVTNGNAKEFKGTQYGFEMSNGEKYTLNEAGTGIINNKGESVTPGDDELGREMQAKLEQASKAFIDDTAEVEKLKTSTATAWETEQTNFTAANTVFDDDSKKIDELTKNYESFVAAQNALTLAEKAQEAAQAAKGENDASFAAANELYHAPILETIANGANDAIDMSLAEGGAINTALAEKASIADLATKADIDTVTANTTAIATNATNITANTTAIATNATNITANTTAIAENKAAIATNTTNIAENKAAIEKNTENIAANKQAIADETAERKAADEQLAKDIKAGDEMTLAAAKAYVDEYNSVALQAANAYTDKKVNALEKELSAGIATATAMSSIEVSNVAKGEVSVGGGYGYYNSQSAVAFGAAMGLTDNWSVNAAAGLADSNVSFRAGTNYKFKLF